MTIMIPADFKSGLMGEEAVFKCIKDCPQSNNWVCFHNLYCGEHHTQQSTEIDFLLIAPPYGAFCIEVKGGTVSHKDGVWTYSGNGKQYSSDRSPFEQARLNALTVIDFLKNRIDIPPFVFNCVIFPFSIFPASAGLQASASHRVLDRTNFSPDGISRFIKCIHGIDCPKAVLTPSIAHKVRTILGPRFEISPSLLSLIDETENRILRYTEDQYKIVETLSQLNHRVVVSGYAGTGKTVMAMDLAMRFSRNNQKTALIVINPLLADHLKKRITEVCLKNKWNPPEVFAISNHSEYVNTKTLFDILIIDEAQDIIVSEDFCIIINELIKDGIEYGKWFFFGDIERQILETESKPVFYNLFNVTPVQLLLKKNCRNTRYIANRALMLGRIQSDSLELPPKSDTDPTVDTIEFKEKEIRSVIKKETKKLCSNGVKKDDIIIIISDGSKFLKDVREEGNACSISCHTVSAFKGLEARCIIFVDPVNKTCGELNPDLIRYVGITRASSKLIILVPEYDKNILEEFYIAKENEYV